MHIPQRSTVFLAALALGCVGCGDVSRRIAMREESLDEQQARGAAIAAKSAWKARDFMTFERVTTVSVLGARADDLAGVVDRLRGSVAVARDRGAAGLEGTLLSLLGEAHSRGLSVETLAAIVKPLRGYRAISVASGQPAWVPVAATRGYGARYLRVNAARAALAVILADPAAGLESALEDGLCSLPIAELEARLGTAAARELKDLCERGSMGAADRLGGPMLTALADFECVLQEAGNGVPTFDEKVTQAAMGCYESLGSSNPIAEGSAARVTSSRTYYPPGGGSLSIITGEIGKLRWLTVEIVRENGCSESRTLLSDGSWSLFEITPNRETRNRGWDENGNLLRDNKSEGYDEDCKQCGGPTEPVEPEILVGEPDEDPDTGIADEFGSTEECVAFEQLLYEHAGKPAIDLSRPRPRDRVSYPTPDAEPAEDVEDCLTLLAGAGAPRTSQACGVQLCAWGSIADPLAGCACEPVSAEFDAERWMDGDCGRIMRCPDGDATFVNGVCTCAGDAEPLDGNGRPVPIPGF